MEKHKQPKDKKVIHEGEKRQVLLENMWLLYNYDVFVEYFWSRKGAWREAIYSITGNFTPTPQGLKKAKECYQVLRGDIAITLHPSNKKIKGDWAVFNGRMKMNKQFLTEEEAWDFVRKIDGGNVRSIKNFKVKNIKAL